jgi:hypothetical protein
MTINKLAKAKAVFFSLLIAFGINLNAEIKKTPKEEDLIKHVMECIDKAEKNMSKIDANILNLEGMSSAKVRHFLNNLCNFPNTTYLEIGCWKGSTLVSALYKNDVSVVDAVAMDNWSIFSGGKEACSYNVNTYLPNVPLNFYEIDCFSLTQEMKREIFQRPVTTYFYDGNHTTESQEMAFTAFNDVFDDVFVAVVDDWIGQGVRDGTYSAFKKLGYTVLYEKACYDGWWYGLYIAVIRK